jgi:GAF domain-containing protein
MVIDNPAGNQKIALRLSQTQKERIRFYAGIPLNNQTGETVGFLCV